MSRQPLLDLVDFTNEALNNVGHDSVVTAVYLDELIHVYHGEEVHVRIATTGEDIADFDFVWLRGRFVPVMNDVALIAEYLEYKGVDYMNHSYAYRSAYGKNAQMFLLSRLGLPFPKTIFAAGEHAATAFMAGLSFPMIIKNNHGAHGEKNYLVDTEQKLHEILTSHPETNFVAQEYIPNDADFRVLIAGDEHLIIRRQGLPGSHLNNTSQGGSATLVSSKDFPAEIVAQARHFAAALHYEISGVDVLFSKDTGKHYFLEANSQPQIISGAFIYEKQALLGRYLASRLSR